jgi:hypothetical protein
MYTNKFKNTGSFAVSAMASALVVGVHLVGLQLLVAEHAPLPMVAPQEQVVDAKVVGTKRVAKIEPIVVTATRL